MNDRHIQKEHPLVTRAKNLCGKVCANEIPCDREAGHSGHHTNKKQQSHEHLVAMRQQRRQGKGRKGLLGRMRVLLHIANSNARTGNYLPPNISAEALVDAWEKQGGNRYNLSQLAACAWTDRPMALMAARAEHNHDTGDFRGFVLNDANTLEGLMTRLTVEEQVKFIERALPEAAYTLLLQQALSAA